MLEHKIPDFVTVLASFGAFVVDISISSVHQPSSWPGHNTHHPASPPVYGMIVRAGTWNFLYLRHRSSTALQLPCQALLTVHRDFNSTVNMTAEELEKWLKGDKSQQTGWSKSDGSGESVGHER